MHGEELLYMKEAYDTNWMSTVGKNIDEVERIGAEATGVKYGVALSCGTAALHLCMKLAGITRGDRVFCSDMTFAATVNPAYYEGANLTFIDEEYDTWNMDPKALRKAFELYPDTKYVVVVNLYGTPAKLDEIRSICDDFKKAVRQIYPFVEAFFFASSDLVSYHSGIQGINDNVFYLRTFIGNALH